MKDNIWKDRYKDNDQLQRKIQLLTHNQNMMALILIF